MNREAKKRRAPAARLVLSRREALVNELLASARGGFPTRCDLGRCAVGQPCGPDNPEQLPT